MRDDPQFARFIDRRETLNEHLDVTRAQVDAWIATHEVGEPTVADLAHLEGLLAQRRDYLAQLAELDDTFMNHLLELREQQRSAQRRPRSE
jgi:hypothetical protein